MDVALLQLERYTIVAGALTQEAQELADELAHAEVTPLHLAARMLELWGARAVLARAGVDAESCRRRAEARLGSLAKSSGRLANVSAELRALLAGAEAKAARDASVGPAHLVAALAELGGDDPLVDALRDNAAAADALGEFLGSLEPSGPTVVSDHATPSVRQFLLRAVKLADANGHAELTALHVLAALLDAGPFARGIGERGHDVAAVQQHYRDALERFPKAKPGQKARSGIAVLAFMRRVEDHAKGEPPTLEHLFAALLDEPGPPFVESLAWFREPPRA